VISGEDFLVSARSRALSKRRTGLCYRARNTLTPEYMVPLALDDGQFDGHPPGSWWPYVAGLERQPRARHSIPVTSGEIGICSGGRGEGGSIPQLA